MAASCVRMAQGSHGHPERAPGSAGAASSWGSLSGLRGTSELAPSPAPPYTPPLGLELDGQALQGVVLGLCSPPLLSLMGPA